jgi:hypothetical protein
LETTPITIHPGRNPEAPFEILRILTEAGAKADKVVMGHLDRTIHEYSKLADFGNEFNCYFEYDLFGIEHSHYQFDENCFMPNDGERLHRIKVIFFESFLIKNSSGLFFALTMKLYISKIHAKDTFAVNMTFEQKNCKISSSK